MSIRMTKAFLPLTEDGLKGISGNLGVYELADDQGKVVFIGYAGGKSLFGLQGELTSMLHSSLATQYRIEVNSAYLTRYQELLMLHLADHGDLPAHNDPSLRQQLGRLSPAG